MTNPIEIMRSKLVAERKIVCTGNPDDPTNIAHGVREIWPNTTFLCRTTGWDLMNPEEEKLASVFQQHNTFINSSHIKAGVQKNLLDICARSVKFYDVVNIGSMHELTGEGGGNYAKAKLELRDASLAYNTFRFQTTHIIMGGIQDQDHPDWLTVDEIAQTIKWCLEQRFKVPLISIVQPPEAW